MFRDKVQEKASTLIGIGAYSVGGASNVVPGWKTWRSQFADGAQVVTWAVNDDESIWEKTYGTLTYGPPDTISRNYLLSSTGSLISWTATDVIYLYSAPISEALEGRYDGTAGFFVPAGKKPYTAVGAANKTVSANAWADAGGRFSLDNSAADRSVILPPIANVGHGSNVEVFGLSQANFINIVPNGSEIVDYGTGGQTLPLPGKVPVLIWKDGTIWRTNFDYSALHTVQIKSPSAAASVDFTTLPYWARKARIRFNVIPATASAGPHIRYSQSGTFNTGANYNWLHHTLETTPNHGVLGSTDQTSLALTHVGLSTTANQRVNGEIEIVDIQTVATHIFSTSKAYGFSDTGIVFKTESTGYFNATSALIDGVRLLMSSGNIANGTVWLDCQG